MREYYLASPYEFYAACEGFLDNRNEQRDLLRFAAFRIAEHFVGSKTIGSLEKFWPLEGEAKKIKLPTAEDRRRILNRFKKDTSDAGRIKL